MTLEHQTQMVDLITRTGWQARMGETPDIEGLVSYMLFAEDTPLVAPVEGVSTFTKTFPERGSAAIVAAGHCAISRSA